MRVSVMSDSSSKARLFSWVRAVDELALQLDYLKHLSLHNQQRHPPEIDGQRGTPLPVTSDT
jgi:hypothetical protein